MSLTYVDNVNIPIPRAHLDTYQYLLNNDFEALEFLFGSRLSQALRVTAQRVANRYAVSENDAMEELRRFLAIKVFMFDTDATRISPTPLMEKLWHAAILDTQLYTELQIALGMTIHHHPSKGDEREARLREDRLAEMTAVYTQHFTSYPIKPGLLRSSSAQNIDSTGTYISIFVHNVEGNITRYFFSSQTTIGLVKMEIKEQEGTPVDQQRLYFAGKKLEDEKTLADYGISNESMLFAILPPTACTELEGLERLKI